MKPKVIKSEADHAATLGRIEQIFAAQPGTPEGDELELLATLVELYESEVHRIPDPDPIEAIRFRMEQQQLEPKDLVPYLGTLSRVSEVLNRKRPLSVGMMRRLSEGLGIPARTLLKESKPEAEPIAGAADLPIGEMVKRGWFAGFRGTAVEARRQLDRLLPLFLGPLGPDALTPAFNRLHVRSGRQVCRAGLAAWRIRVTSLASFQKLPAYRSGTIDSIFMQELARLSCLEAGPALASEFLQKNGVSLVVERHLPRTYLDGAAMKLPTRSPVVALTLRHDRLDNFWFTLAHECAHVALHLDRDNVEAFFDNLDDKALDKCEKEADRFAADALIPRDRWQAARLTSRTSRAVIIRYAREWRISPAIIAGRIGYESGNFALYRDLLGHGEVRRKLEPASAPPS